MAVPAGFPTSNNTGVPAGVTLTPSGTIVIDTPGAVISGLDITGGVIINAPNVTLKNCRITGTGFWTVYVTGDNVKIEDCEIRGSDGNSGTKGIFFDETYGGSVTRCNIYRAEDGIYIAAKNTVVSDNYIHDLTATGSDPHYDGIQLSGGATGTTIRHNSVTVRDGDNSAITTGGVQHVLIENNYLDGGAYTLRVDGRNGLPVSDVSIINNIFGSHIWGDMSFDNASPSHSGNVTETGIPLDGAGTTPPPSPPPPPPPSPDPTPTPDDHTFTGTNGNDVIPLSGESNAGNETLYGLGGNDILAGGAGGDTIDGGSGTDTATYAGSTVGVTVNLQAGTAFGGHATGDRLVSIENLTGSSYNDTLTGNSNNNVLDGGAGADLMRGGVGDDTYVVDNPGDIIDESVAGSNGSDTVRTSMSFSLADTTRVLGDVGLLVLTGTANINGTGNGLGNTITGNSGNNVLNGHTANDTLTGAGGDDTFVFSDPLNAANNVDSITDFTPADDTIQLDNAVFTALTASLSGTLSRGSFYIGEAAHDSTDRIIYNPATGALVYDSNGDAAGGATQFATLDTGLSLTRWDFTVA